MSILGNRIRHLRESNNLNQMELAAKLNISNSTLCQYETGYRIPSDEVKLAIARLFNVSIDFLLGNDPVPNLRPLAESLSAGKTIPVLGKVPAGIPIEAVEEIIDEIELSKKMTEDQHDYFALLVSGNSMYPEYLDGDIVIVRKQDTAETGDDVIAYVNGYDATLKRLVRSVKGITLRPLNSEFETHTYTQEDIEALPVRIAGIVVEQRRNRK